MFRVLIAGCGYLGVALGQRLTRAGHTVLAATHSAESAATLTATYGWPALACDLSDSASVAALATKGPVDAVVHCASSGRGGADAYRRVYLQGMEHLVQHFPGAYVLFTSSTSVYPQVDGAVVTEESPAEPDRQTGRLLRAAEAVALAAGGAAARLAGLYGPGRSVLLRKFLTGEAVIEGDGLRWLNQIHRDDAAGALHHLLEQRAAGLFNVADGTPLHQLDLYQGLAQRLQKPLPPSGPIPTDRKRGWTHKQVSGAKLRDLGWTPRYPSFFHAVDNDPELLPAATSGCG